MITPSQAKHLTANWQPIVLHAEKPELAVCHVERCVTADDLRRAAITATDLLDEEGGMYVGMETIKGTERVYCFDVLTTQKRAAMSWSQWEELLKNNKEKMEVGG